MAAGTAARSRDGVRRPERGRLPSCAGYQLWRLVVDGGLEFHDVVEFGAHRDVGDALEDGLDGRVRVGDADAKARRHGPAEWTGLPGVDPVAGFVDVQELSGGDL